MLTAVLLILGCFVLWTSAFADLSDLDFTQENNDSTLWDKWVSDNGFKAIGDIWDSCG